MDALASVNSVDTIKIGEKSRSPGQSLGAEGFLKLLTIQLTHQAPLEPMRDTDFIAQMASFSSLEQMRELTEDFNHFAGNQDRAAAQALLGRNVVLKGGEGSPLGGRVDAVSLGEDGIKVSVNGAHYGVEQILQIQHSNQAEKP